MYSEAARVYQFRDVSNFLNEIVYNLKLEYSEKKCFKVCSSGQPSALTSLGDLMSASHASCKDHYEVIFVILMVTILMVTIIILLVPVLFNWS